jgi:hypothetical protein
MMHVYLPCKLESVAYQLGAAPAALHGDEEWFLDQVPDLREILTLRLAPGCGAEEPRAC